MKIIMAMTTNSTKNCATYFLIKFSFFERNFALVGKSGKKWEKIGGRKKKLPPPKPTRTKGLKGVGGKKGKNIALLHRKLKIQLFSKQ